MVGGELPVTARVAPRRASQQLRGPGLHQPVGLQLRRGEELAEQVNDLLAVGRLEALAGRLQFCLHPQPPIGAGRAGAGQQDHCAHQVGSLGGQMLGHKPPKGEADQPTPTKAKQLDEPHRVGRQVGDV